MVKVPDYGRKSGMCEVLCPTPYWSSLLIREKVLKPPRCKKCKGKKVVKEKKRVEFNIEPGTEDGERIALRGEGDAAVRPILLFLLLF